MSTFHLDILNSKFNTISLIIKQNMPKKMFIKIDVVVFYYFSKLTKINI